MNRLQLIIVGAALVLWGLIYFGGGLKSTKKAEIETSRNINAQVADVNSLIIDAKKSLNAQQLALVQTVESKIADKTASEGAKVDVLKEASSAWYKLGFPAIAGSYASEVATVAPSDSAWAIAGTTFAIGLKQAKNDRDKEYCSQNAVTAFENAISLNPNEVSHRLNLSLVYTETPPKDNPMKGILMLRELADQFPNDTRVLVNLGQLAIKTGQFDKAKIRLEKAISVEPNNMAAICLLAQTYESLGETENAKKFSAQCQN